MIDFLRKVPIPVLLILAVITIGSAAAVATLTVTTTTTTAIFAAEDLQVDSSAMVSNTSVLKVSASTTATGQTQGAAVESTVATFATVNSTIDSENFVYQFEVMESSASGWGSTRVYSVELFADGTLLDTLFIKNATADGSNVEGATAQFDLGSSTSLPGGITVKVTKVVD